MIKNLLLTTLLLLAPCSLFAGAENLCDNASTQMDINQCAAETYQREDIVLNSLYQEVLTLITKEQISSLKKAQRAWLNYRDLHCAFEASSYKGGSIYPTIYFNCLTEITAQRNAILNAIKLDNSL